MAKKDTTAENTAELNDCFVIMPISDHDGYENGHFKSVYLDIFKPAIEKAGMIAIRADDVKQTNLIHLDILEKLIKSPMAICDLSTRNPNVLFELGLRQAFDKPTVLVQEFGTPKIFDISLLRLTEYRKELKYREVLEDQLGIYEAIIETRKAVEAGKGVNSLISLLSLSNPAELADPTQKEENYLLKLIIEQVNNLSNQIKQNRANSLTFIPPRTHANKAIMEGLEGLFQNFKQEVSANSAPLAVVLPLFDELNNRVVEVTTNDNFIEYEKRRAREIRMLPRELIQRRFSEIELSNGV